MAGKFGRFAACGMTSLRLLLTFHLMFKRLLAALLFLIPTTAAEAKGPALWAVKDGDTTVYLFGTIHMLPKGMDWLSGAPADALAKSDTLVTELVLPDPKAAAITMMAAGVSDTVPPLSSRVPASAAPALSSAVKASGLPPEVFDKMKTWMAAVTLTNSSLAKMDFASSEGVEMRLEEAAKGKRRLGLETIGQQVGVFETMSEAEQRALLTNTIAQLPQLENQAQSLVGYWTGGDTDALAATINDDLAGSPALAKVLLTDRNARWADWIANRMTTTPGTVFVAVGAGHLAGPDSVQAMLAKKGLTAVRVAS